MRTNPLLSIRRAEATLSTHASRTLLEVDVSSVDACLYPQELISNAKANPWKGDLTSTFIPTDIQVVCVSYVVSSSHHSH